MYHDCRSSLCDTPHYENDDHSDDCLCELCHDHFDDWNSWNIYPECDGCLNAMSHWIHENTDFVGCPFPELCDYSKSCRKGEN